MHRLVFSLRIEAKSCVTICYAVNAAVEEQERMFKLGSRILITAVLLSLALVLAGSHGASAEQRSAVLDPIGNGPSSIEPIGMPDSGEPDIGQTRDRSGDGGAPGGGEQVLLSTVRDADGLVRWLSVMWALRYLGLGGR